MKLRPIEFNSATSHQSWQAIVPARYNGGKRWAQRFHTKKECQEFCDRFNLDPRGVVSELHGIKTGVLPEEFAPKDRRDAEYVLSSMHKILKTHDINVAIKAFQAYAETMFMVQVTVAEAVAQYHAHRTTRDLDPRVLADDKTRLNRLVIHLGNEQLSSVTTEQLRKFFCTIPLGQDGTASNRITYRMKMGPFFKWAAGEAKLLKENPITPITKDHLGEMGVNNQYYEVEEFGRMLRIAQGVEPVREGGECTDEFRDTLFPWFIISGFAGVRSSEVMRNTLDDDALRWDDIHLDGETPHIHIRSEVGKSGKQRHIEAPWALDAVRSWTALIDRKGPFVCGTVRQIEVARGRFTEATGIELNENGFRNSFGTYGRAVFGSTVLVAEQLGNSPAIAQKYYVRSLPSGRGQAYFGLRPLELVENVA